MIFKKPGVSIPQNKGKIRIELDKTKNRTDNWLDITEKAFIFFTNLSEIFNQGNSKTKMNILIALGKNIKIMDGKLSIEPFERWISIKESHPELEAEYLELKLSEIENLSTEIDIFEPICKTWLATIHNVRTRLLSMNKNIFIPGLRY